MENYPLPRRTGRRDHANVFSLKQQAKKKKMDGEREREREVETVCGAQPRTEPGF